MTSAAAPALQSSLDIRPLTPVIGAEISGIDGEMGRERRAVVRELYPEPERPLTPERSMSYGHDRGIDPPDLGYDLGL